jgi:membrane protein
MRQTPDPERTLEYPSARARAGDFARLGPSFKFFLGRVYNTHISSAAAALSYSTTLAVIPALALVLASLAAFPAFDGFRAGIQSLIINNLVPDTGQQLSETLGSFIAAAGKLTGVGIVGLATTAILLLLTIEGQLNLIFGVTRPRSLYARVLVLWALVTLGPLLLAVGYSLFANFSALFMPDGGMNKGVTFLLGHVAPTMITWGLLSFIYNVVPHNRVHWRDAMLGAVFAAVLLALLRYTFAFYIVMMTSYQAIYGAIAAVPVFLVWVYFVWFIVMAGAVVSAAMPDWRLLRLGRRGGTGGRLLLALETLAALAQAQRHGQGCDGVHLARGAGLPEDIVVLLLESLQAGHFVVCSTDGQWVLGCDLDTTPLGDLVHHFGIGLDRTVLRLPEASGLALRLEQVLAQAVECEERLLSVSLARVIAPEAVP